MPGITFARAAEHVQGSLRDPLAPKFCVRYYLYFIHLIRFDHPVNNLLPIAPKKRSSLYGNIMLSNIRATHPGLLQAFMTFIQTERSRDDIRILAQRMETCNCDRTDPVVYEFHCWHWINYATRPAGLSKYPPGFMPHRDDMESLMIAIACLLSSPIDVNLEAAIHIVPSTRASGWPFSLKDIVGPDPSKSATQLCRWLDEYPSFQLIHLLSYFSDDPAVVPTFMRSATLPRTIVQLLNRALAEVPANIAEYDFAIRMWYKYPLTITAEFMARMEGIEPDGVSLAYFYDDQAEPLLDVLTRIGHVQQGTFDDMLLYSMLSKTGGAVHAKLVLPFDETRYHPHILAGSRQFKGKNISDACARPWETTRNVLYILTMTPICANQPCRNQFQATWPRCAACRRVLYCSPKCQQADWGHAHKKICKTLKAVGDAVGFPVATTAAPPVISPTDFRNQCVKAGVSRDALEPMLQRVLLDDRIMKILNAEPYSKRYECRLS